MKTRYSESASRQDARFSGKRVEARWVVQLRSPDWVNVPAVTPLIEKENRSRERHFETDHLLRNLNGCICSPAGVIVGVFTVLDSRLEEAIHLTKLYQT